MVDPLQEALCTRPQFGVRVVGDEGAAGGPRGCVCDPLDELEGQDEPRPGDEGDVDETDTVAEEPGRQDLDVTHTVDQFPGIEIGCHLGQMIDHGGNAK